MPTTAVLWLLYLIVLHTLAVIGLVALATALVGGNSLAGYDRENR